MTQEEAFIQSILDEPADESLRLIFADWLEEHGRGRHAEFIRLQITRARLPLDDPQRVALYRREERLLFDNPNDWLGPLARWLSLWHFRRGFLERARVPAHILVTHDAHLFALGPLHVLTVEGPGSLAEAIANCRCLGRVAILHLRLSPLSEEGASSLAAPGILSNLTMLHLTGSQMNSLGLAALLSGAPFTRLTHLSLSHNFIDDPGAEVLATTVNLPRLLKLDLTGNRIGPAGIAALARSPALARLEILGLQNNPLGDEGARALVASAHLSPDLALQVPGADLSDETIDALRQRFPRRLHVFPLLPRRELPY
jgi:uncharacterized protein (TIGR02996 family)